MKRWIVLGALFLAVLLVPATPEPEGSSPAGPDGPVASLLDRAETLFAEGSFALAREAYERLAAAPLDADDRRWVAFRLEDSAWRSAAATDVADMTEIERSRERLEEMLGAYERVEQQDRLWAEIQESLGDSWWSRRSSNWHAGWGRYRVALDWWSASRDVDLARERYLGIVWKASDAPQPEPYRAYGSYGGQIPVEILQGARRIARPGPERARASYLLAMALRGQGAQRASHRRVREAFEAAIDAGPDTEWYDDALYEYGEWLARSGRLERSESGAWIAQPDFPGAVKWFRRIVDTFSEGRTRYYEPARNRLSEITDPAVGVAVTNVFLSGSEIDYLLSWRNVPAVDLALYPVALTRDVRFDGGAGQDAWLQQIDLRGRQPVRTWSESTGDDGDHRPRRETLRLSGSLDAGAYVLEAESSGRSARDLILVTETSLVLKTTDEQAIVYVCDALDGSPRPGAEIALSWARNPKGRMEWRTTRAEADARGLATFDLGDEGGRVNLFVASRSGDEQAFATGRAYSRSGSDDPWKLYAFTDRPAYRPNETVRFKVVARHSMDGAYVTPSGAELRYEIVDPRGTKMPEQTAALNGFGSAWGSVELDASMPLGEYWIRFRDGSTGRSIGSSVLFRLEEYKLPEFRVLVETPEENGAPKTYRVGETVEADVVAEYYFGGPVAGASVELLVYQKPLYVRWQAPHEFPWYFDDVRSGRQQWGGTGQVVHRETLTTDADGRARLTFDPPAGGDVDSEFTIEARVTDASRREVSGRGTVKVSRQRYFAFVQAGHNLYRPGDRVRAEVKAVDSNGQPVAGAAGRVTVTRDRWRVKPERYDRKEVFTRSLTTGESGTAELSFVPETAGYYRIAWSGDETEDYPVRGETTVWVADRDTTDLGYRHGGVEILVDRDTVRAGGKTPVMLSAESAGAWVLFTVEGDGLYEHRVVHLEGTVKLLELDVDARYVPNVFLEASMVRDGELHVAAREVIVPPADRFLSVTVAADAEDHLPGERGWLEVTTLDHAGNPVAAEVALALVDASIFAIQEDRSGDPRPFFYGDKRSRRVGTHTSFAYRPYRPAGADSTDTPTPRNERAEQRMREDEGFARGVAVKSRSMADAMAPPVAAMEMDFATSVGGVAVGGVAGGDAVEVRTDFRSTALWVPDVVTGADGRARVEVSYPDSLTSWKATARAATRGSRFGIAEGSTRTSKPLMVRLQAPRFFVVGDEVTVSALVNNDTGASQSVSVTLDAKGLDAPSPLQQRIAVPAGGEARVDWRLSAGAAGSATLQVVARDGRHDDAMQRAYPVHEHGIEKFLSQSGKLTGDRAQIEVDLPHRRRPGSTRMTVRVAPSLAVTMLDALPYLIDYPYGCTEQTMSRFLPAVVTARTLERLGLKPEAVAGRIFGGVERQHADATHPGGTKSLEELNRMVRKGLRRLADFQHGDGGWGWWKQGDSDPFMTAYVVWGLSLAREAKVDFDRSLVDRGVQFLERELVSFEEQPRLQAFMLHAVSAARAANRRGSPGELQQRAFENLWNKRDELGAYGRALLALSAHHHGDTERASTLVRNLANGVQRDRSGSMETAHWGTSGFYWRWYDGAVESTAFALRAMLAIDPDNELVEPVTTWLVRNRRGAQWSNTRDTAITILALGGYLEASGELGSTLEYEVLVNGKSAGGGRFDPGEALGARAELAVDANRLRDGANEIRIVRRDGEGPIYYAVETLFFSEQEPVTAAGNEIFVRREYYRLAGRPTLLAGYVYDRVPLEDGGRITSGERVEVVVTVEAKNDYEYLVFEDLKPAGLEAVELKSGGSFHARELASEPGKYTGRARWVHQELRDRKVAMFVDKLPQGVWELRYELRAEVPGEFHALPVLGHAMYVPEVRCNGDEIRIGVDDS